MKGSVFTAAPWGHWGSYKALDAVHQLLTSCSSYYLILCSAQPYVVYSINLDYYDNQERGFTIVETLIVLSVTSALFLGAATFISGRQNNTQFQQASREVQSQIQAVMNEVASGQYQTTGSLRCRQTGGGVKLDTVSVGPGTSTQGRNQSCMYLGKVLQFAVHSTDPDPEQFIVYPLAGLSGSDASPVLNLLAARPKVVAPALGADAGNPAMHDTKRLLNGLKVTKMYYRTCDTAACPKVEIGAVGFVSSISSLGSADSSQQVNVVAIPGTSRNQTQQVGAGQINANIAAGVVNPAGGVSICFQSGTNDLFSLVTIGAAGRQSAVDIVTKTVCS
ncbi:MAG TPA: hypothetical protein VK983_02430 [Candidatus Limnocylindrales bacterium]|nr:hypothetical protein [Candidatus Limnocylindrales bacterium]